MFIRANQSGLWKEEESERVLSNNSKLGSPLVQCGEFFVCSTFGKVLSLLIKPANTKTKVFTV